MKTKHTTKCFTCKTWLFLLGISLFFALITSQHSVSAQGTSGTATTPAKSNFYQIQKNFNDYWEGREVTRGSGYKPFKRWEWYWEARVNHDGTFPPNNVVVKEWERYSAEHTTDNSDAAGNWKSLGPDKPENRYFGVGRVNCIAFHPNDINTFWVGTPAGGLWKTTDFGKTWTTNFDRQPILGISEIVIDPKNSNTMYIATGDYDGGDNKFNGTGSGDTKSLGILKSTDGGLTWKKTGLSFEIGKDKEYQVSRLIMNPDTSSILFATTSCGIYKLMNGGQDTVSVGPTLNFCDIVYKPGTTKTMYAATKSAYKRSAQIYRSVDWGKSWDSVTKFTNINRIKLAVTPKNPNMVEALCVLDSVYGGLAGIFRSINDGATFGDTIVKVFKNCSNNYLHSYVDPEMYNDACGGQGWYDLCYLIDPDSLNIRWLGGINTWKSTDGGKEFNLASYWEKSVEQINLEQVHADKHAFAFHPLKKGTFFDCNDGGVYYTQDGGKKWTDISGGLQIGQIYRIGSSWEVKDLIIAGFQDNGSQVRTAPGEWLTPDAIGGDGMDCLIDWLDPNIRYACYSDGVIKRTLNGTWKEDCTLISDSIKTKNRGAWITPIASDPINPEILYAGYRDIWKTTNRGDKWDSITRMDHKIPGDFQFRTMAIAPYDPKVIWAGTMKSLYMTTNGGGNMKAIDTLKLTALGKNKNMITGIAIHPTNPKKVFVTFSGYDSLKVFSTIDGGESWKDISGSNLPKVPVNCITYEDFSNDALYIGTDLGVFYRDSTLSNWIPFNNQLPNVMVTDLDICYMEGTIRAATFGRGIWESDLYVPSGKIKVNEIEVPRNGGDASGGGLYKIGDTVIMKATPLKSFSFMGWFENGTKINDSANFTFIAQGNRNLEARFGYPTSIENNLKAKIQLFPNPTKGQVEIRMDEGMWANLQNISLTSQMGKTVYRSSVNPEGDKLSVDLSFFSPGNYLLTLYFKSGEKVSYSLILTK